jgi:hypothetical protein
MTVPLAIEGCPGTAEATHRPPPPAHNILFVNGAAGCHVTSRPLPGAVRIPNRTAWWLPGAGGPAPNFNPLRRPRRSSRASCRRVHEHRRALVGRSSRNGKPVPSPAPQPNSAAYLARRRRLRPFCPSRLSATLQKSPAARGRILFPL